jgi:hypothetical protein
MILPNDFTESVVTVAPYELRAHGPNASQFSSDFERERTAKFRLQLLPMTMTLRLQLAARSVINLLSQCRGTTPTRG